MQSIWSLNLILNGSNTAQLQRACCGYNPFTVCVQGSMHIPDSKQRSLTDILYSPVRRCCAGRLLIFDNPSTVRYSTLHLSARFRYDSSKYIGGDACKSSELVFKLRPPARSWWSEIWVALSGWGEGMGAHFRQYDETFKKRSCKSLYWETANEKRYFEKVCNFLRY